MIAEGPLGRREPENWEHVDRYPLTAERLDEITIPSPVVLGVNWYTNFDRPQDGWIGRGSLGRVRGGHCVVLKPAGVIDNLAWWRFYNQGSEGACVGFGASRAMSLLNRKRYFARWLWDRAKEIDYWDDTQPGDSHGTSVKAALDVLRQRGHVAWRNLDSYVQMNTNGESADWVQRAQLQPSPAEGIAANRWVRSMDDMLQVLGHPGRDYCILLNSWGESYPHSVRIPVSTLERLWRENGEFGVVTDR